MRCVGTSRFAWTSVRCVFREPASQSFKGSKAQRRSLPEMPLRFASQGPQALVELPLLVADLLWHGHAHPNVHIPFGFALAAETGQPLVLEPQYRIGLDS